MRSLTFVGPKKLVWRDVAEPRLHSPTDALVRPFVAARCDGDSVFLRHDVERALRFGALLHVLDPDFRTKKKNPFVGPFAYGHECVAEVVSCGGAVKSVAPGDVVVVPWAISCGTCGRCGAGLTSKCEKNEPERALSAFGFGQAFGNFGGAVSDTLRVPMADAMLLRVPDGVDPVSVASASDNIPDGYRAVAPLLADNPQAPVLIVGGGAKSIGLYAVGIAKALGASRVDYLDTSTTRLRIAETLGAEAISVRSSRSWFERGAPPLRGGYPITVDASSTATGLKYAIDVLAPGGTCTALGFYFRRGTPLPLWSMYLNDATLRIGVAHAREHLPAVLDLIAQKRFNPSVVTTLLSPWDDAPRALLEPSTKVVLQRPRLAAS